MKVWLWQLEKQIDINFSYAGCFFCNSSHDKIKFFIYPDLDRKYWKKWKCQNPQTHWQPIWQWRWREFIDQNYVKSTGFKTQLLDETIMAWNVDGMENKKGKITSFVDLKLTINGQTNGTWLLVTGLGKQRVILGFPWLNKHNPIIDWKTEKFK